MSITFTFIVYLSFAVTHIIIGIIIIINCDFFVTLVIICFTAE
jgi:hypothetical protein